MRLSSASTWPAYSRACAAGVRPPAAGALHLRARLHAAPGRSTAACRACCAGPPACWRAGCRPATAPASPARRPSADECVLQLRGAATDVHLGDGPRRVCGDPVPAAPAEEGLRARGGERLLNACSLRQLGRMHHVRHVLPGGHGGDALKGEVQGGHLLEHLCLPAQAQPGARRGRPRRGPSSSPRSPPSRAGSPGSGRSPRRPCPGTRPPRLQKAQRCRGRWK